MVVVALLKRTEAAKIQENLSLASLPIVVLHYELYLSPSVSSITVVDAGNLQTKFHLGIARNTSIDIIVLLRALRPDLVILC